MLPGGRMQPPAFSSSSSSSQARVQPVCCNLTYILRLDKPTYHIGSLPLGTRQRFTNKYSTSHNSYRILPRLVGLSFPALRAWHPERGQGGGLLVGLWCVHGFFAIQSIFQIPVFGYFLPKTGNSGRRWLHSIYKLEDP